MLSMRTCPHRRLRSGSRRRQRRVWAPACIAVLIAALTLPAAAGAKAISKSTWVKGVQLTEYFPVPESWFLGKRVSTPGYGGSHRVDWLYSARGLSMEGDGVDTSGRKVHIDGLGSSGWVNAEGRTFTFGKSSGSPFWRGENLWKNSSGAVTFPLLNGGWSRGTGKKFIANKGITFAAGASRDLNYYRSIAVDPGTIPMRSRVYLPAYKKAAYGGWMCAVDTGGAINGKHIDVYRPAPKEAFGSGYSLSGEQVYVVPPGKSVGKGGPKMSRDPC